MTTYDLSPFFRSSIGFDQLSSLLDSTLRADSSANGFPPYNIEVSGENQYTITLALAGFSDNDLNIQVANNVLTVSGKPSDGEQSAQPEYLHKGFVTREFERKFNLADYVEVSGAKLENGLLAIKLVKNIPEVMKPRQIFIKSESKVLENKAAKSEAA